MGVWVSGDIHSEPKRFNTRNFPDQLEFSEENNDENIVIVTGDFGVIWQWDGESAHERYWLDWLESKPFTTVFVDGNHECFPRLNAFPVQEWHDGTLDAADPLWKEKAKALRDDDRFMYRVKGCDWWEEELPTAEEMANALLNLKKHGNKVDYILTHCPPASIIARLLAA